MKAGNIEDIYTLSPMQQGMLFHSLYSPEAGLYVSQLSCTFEEGFNVEAFERAWQQVVDRHSIFRTSFIWEGLDEAVQVVHERVKMPFEHLDWRELSSTEQQERLETYLQAERLRNFDFSEAPLMRITLIRLGEESYQFAWTYQHMLMDAWSESLVVNEVFAFYWTICRGENLQLEPSRPYGDYIEWLQQQDISEAEAFWRRTLKGFNAPLRLNKQHAFAESQGQEQTHSEQHRQLSEIATAAVKTMARRHQLTLNAVIQGAWALILSHYSGETDVVFGANVSGRPASLPGVESIIGIFINTLPVRVEIEPQSSLALWLKKLQDQQAEMRQYEYSSLVKIQEWSGIPRGVPLFESIIVFQNAPVNTSLRKHWDESGKLRIQNLRFRGGWTNYALSLDVKPADSLLLNISYDRRRFDDATIRQMLEGLETLLQTFAAQPEVRLEALREALAEADRQQQLRLEKELEAANLQKLSKVKRKSVRAATEHKDESLNARNSKLAVS